MTSKPVEGGIAEQVMARFAALAPEQRTVEAWSRLVVQEVLREVADFLAKAAVEMIEQQLVPRWRWKERSRFVRLLNRRIGCLRR